MILDDHLPAPELALLRHVWETKDGLPDGFEVYGFRWQEQTFMAKHPTEPMFLADFDITADDITVTVIIGRTGHGVTLLTRNGAIPT